MALELGRHALRDDDLAAPDARPLTVDEGTGEGDAGGGVPVAEDIDVAGDPEVLAGDGEGGTVDLDVDLADRDRGGVGLVRPVVARGLGFGVARGRAVE